MKHSIRQDRNRIKDILDSQTSISDEFVKLYETP